MEVVHTLDIDGSQWELQDVVARNQIADIEKLLTPQDLNDIEITMNEGYAATTAVLRSHYKIGKIHFAIVQIDNIRGKNIGTSVTANIGHINIHPKKTTSFILHDYHNSIVIRASLVNDGTVTMDESVGLIQGDSVSLGEIIFVEE